MVLAVLNRTGLDDMGYAVVAVPGAVGAVRGGEEKTRKILPVTLPVTFGRRHMARLGGEEIG
jgi:hypothetical protein